MKSTARERVREKAREIQKGIQRIGTLKLFFYWFFFFLITIQIWELTQVFIFFLVFFAENIKKKKIGKLLRPETPRGPAKALSTNEAGSPTGGKPAMLSPRAMQPADARSVDVFKGNSFFF